MEPRYQISIYDKKEKKVIRERSVIQAYSIEQARERFTRRTGIDLSQEKLVVSVHRI